MRVLLAIPCLERGGTEMQTLCLAKALIEAGHIVNVVCYFNFEQSVVDEFVAIGGHVEFLRLQRGLSSLRFITIMKTFYRGSQPDIVHVQYMSPGALAVVAARIAGVKTVLATVHQPYTESHGWHAKMILLTASMLCDHFIAVSAIAEESWFGSSYVYNTESDGTRHKHFTLHNAVDVSRISGLLSSADSTGLPGYYALDSSFVFGFVGRVSYEKGLDILLEAFGKVSARIDNAKLLIVGDGDDLADLRKRYRHETWWKNVVIAGLQTWENAMRHLVLIDVLVVPSRFEGFGLSAVEGMAASLPVIASDTGGLTEIIQDGESGLLFETGNVDELAERMSRLYDDKSLIRFVSARAKLRAMEYDSEKYNYKVEHFYKSLCP